jgi:hypothetical protein
MKNFERLNKNEMKMIVGGDDRLAAVAGDDCSSQCTTDAGCPAGKKCVGYRTSCPTPMVGICQ